LKGKGKLNPVTGYVICPVDELVELQLGIEDDRPTREKT